ncbi:MAG: hypothetical protein ACP5PV_03755 [Methanothrix sp.]
MSGCDLDDFINYINSNKKVTGKILHNRKRPGVGDIVEITAEGVDWAGEWATKYGNARDHHGQKSRNIY